MSDAPKGTLIFAFAFTAQPLESRIGPRFRFRSFSQASTIEGPEMIRIIARTPIGIIPLKERVADTYFDPIMWVARKLGGNKEK